MKCVAAHFWRYGVNPSTNIFTFSGAPVCAGWASPLRGGDRRRRELWARALVAGAGRPAQTDGAVTIWPVGIKGLALFEDAIDQPHQFAHGGDHDALAAFAPGFK